MDIFIDGYKKLNLPVKAPESYKSPEQLSQGFKKASLLRNDSVNYSTTSSLASSSHSESSQYIK
jgi:hypothetical protein